MHVCIPYEEGEVTLRRCEKRISIQKKNEKHLRN